MKPTIVLVGRPNVGKSTLFNRLTKSRDALVHDLPGLTRDRHYGHGRVGSKPFLVVDTGGFEPVADTGILAEMARQTLQAVAEGDAVIFLVDGRSGVTPQDRIIAEKLRRTGRPVLVAVNKTEGMNAGVVTAEFHELGLGAAHRGLRRPRRGRAGTHRTGDGALRAGARGGPPDDHPKIAIVGRPNVGKSTLVNTFVGEERVIAFDQPGTTRDSIYVDFERDGTQLHPHRHRRRAAQGPGYEAIEKFSVIKTLQAIEDANVVILVLDAQQEVSDQDAHLAGFILEAGRALVVVVNKWDNLDDYQRDRIKKELERRMIFLSFARFHFISALKGTGIGRRAEIGGRGLRRRHGQAVRRRASPRCCRTPWPSTTAQGRQLPAEAQVRPPGRQQPAHHRGARQSPGRHARRLQALSGKRLPHRLQSPGHAPARGLQGQLQPLRRPRGQDRDPAPGAQRRAGTEAHATPPARGQRASEEALGRHPPTASARADIQGSVHSVRCARAGGQFGMSARTVLARGRCVALLHATAAHVFFFATSLVSTPRCNH
jgi:GTP-binding protein